MRKLVTPADPKASIPDPDRGGFLPAEGRAVTWTPYWAGMALREEITVAEVPTEAPAAEIEPEPTAEVEPEASHAA